eukprot:s4956_g3.t1
MPKHKNNNSSCCRSQFFRAWGPISSITADEQRAYQLMVQHLPRDDFAEKVTLDGLLTDGIRQRRPQPPPVVEEDVPFSAEVWSLWSPWLLNAVTLHGSTLGIPFARRRECNQIATVLGLPDTIPEVELAMDMPSGCVWQKATSKLWLNPVVDVVNASDPSQKVTMRASEEMTELCLCKPTEEYYWEVGEWRPCYKSMDANCHGVWSLEDVRGWKSV